jgi:hypothetical protein
MAGADFASIGRPVPFEFDTTEEFTLLVPAGQIWEVQAISFRWIATATVGQRRPLISVDTGNNERLYRRSMLVEIAENEAPRMTWAPGVPDETAFNTPSYLMQSLLMISGPSAEVSIQDGNAIDVLDQLKGSIQVRVYDGEPQ